MIAYQRLLAVDVHNGPVTATGLIDHNHLSDLAIPGIWLELIRINDRINPIRKSISGSTWTSPMAALLPFIRMGPTVNLHR
jgi:hypothetical protein